MTVCVLTGAQASAPVPSVSEVAPGVYSVKNLPISEDGSESSVAADEVARFKASRSAGWSSQEVEASATDHADLGAVGAENLFLDEFGAQVGDLLEDPAATLRSAEEIIGFRDDFTAVVDPAGPADRALVVSTAPIRTDDGTLPDLGLESSGSLISVKEPTTEVEFSKDPQEGIEIPQTDVGISFDEVRASAPDGSIVAVDGGGSGEAAFYPNALTDTDLIAAPLANGVETFAQLRSEDSPEEITMPVDTPDGGSVSASEDGGAVVMGANGDPVAQVYPPTAVDAKGDAVPMTMSVDGADLVLNVAHQNLGFAYPILVDPVVETWNWWTGTHTTYPGWQFLKIGDDDYQGSTYCFQVTIDSCGAPSSGGGLFAYAGPNKQYTQSSQARWMFVPPGSDSYIDAATVTSWRYKKGGAPNGNPFAYWGIATGFLWNDYQITDLDSGGNNRTVQGGTDARQFAMGLTTNSTMTLPAGTTNWRYNRIGAIQFSLGDKTSPNLNPISTTGLNIPASGWINQAQINSNRSIHASAWDSGLGVKKIVVLGAAAAGGWYSEAWDSGCTGGFQGLCSGTTPSGGVDIPVRPSALNEGVQTLTALAIDAKDTNSTAQTFQLKIDRTSPTLDLSDQLAEITNENGSSPGGSQTGDTEILSLPAYQLDISGNDAKAGVGSVSGLASVEIYLDPPAIGDRAPSRVYAKSDFCSGSTCPTIGNATWALKLTSLEPGPHRLEVVATDKAGNKTTRPIEFAYLPKTGIQDDYAMQYVQFPEGEEIAVNVTNGNLVYETKDANPQGLNTGIDLDRYYNSQLPEGSETALAPGWTLSSETSIDPDNIGVGPDGGDVGIVGETTSPTTDVKVPASNDDPEFDPTLRATVETSEDDRYIVSNVRTDETTVYDEDGKLDQQIDELGHAADYSYDGGGRLESVETVEPTPYPPATLELSYSGGRVEEIAPSDGSPIQYEYSSGGELTSVQQGAQGEQYEYDANGLLKKIETKDGSTATVTYDSLRRVMSIVLNPSSGISETTSFSYDSDPNRTGRHTIVTEPSNRVVTYLISTNGDVLRSIVLDSNLQLILSGTLYAKSGSILTPGSYSLEIDGVGNNIWQAEIAIDDIAIDELTCDPTCTNYSKTWTVDQAELAEGINNVRILLTRQNGDYVDQRFQVYVPQRSDVGDETESVILPTSAEAIAERANQGFTDNSQVGEMLGNPDYLPIIQQWGAPYSLVELAELDYRTAFRERVQPIIESYGAANPNDYAGYEIPEPDDGTVVVGFTHSGASHLAALRELVGEGGYRIVLQSPAPTRTSKETSDIAGDVVEDQNNNLIPTWVGVEAVISDEADGFVGVLVDNVTPTAVDWIRATYGAGIEVSKFEPLKQRNPLRAGGFYGGIIRDNLGGGCSIGYGTRREKGTKANGKYRYTYYVMSAGHCYTDEPGGPGPVPPEINGRRFGKWNANLVASTGSFDAGAIRLNTANVPRVPRTVRRRSGGGLRLLGVNWDWSSVTSPKSLCVTGAIGDTICGKARPRLAYWQNGRSTAVLSFDVGPGEHPTKDGDSGGLVWDRRNNAIVGLFTGEVPYIKNGRKYYVGYFTPTSYVKDAWPSLKTVLASTKIR